MADRTTRSPNKKDHLSTAIARGLDDRGFNFKNQGVRIGIVSARWNKNVNQLLVDGCVQACKDSGVDDADFVIEYVAGAYELPYAAKLLCQSGEVDAVIAVGSLVKGETMHFEYIAEAVTQGIMKLNVEGNIPVIYGVLTVLSLDQAKQRCGVDGPNSGYEWGKSALEQLALRAKYDREWGRGRKM